MMVFLLLHILISFSSSGQAFQFSNRVRLNHSPLKLSDTTASISPITSIRDQIFLEPPRPKRILPFTLLCAFAIAVSYADRSTLSTAIIPMAKQFQWDNTLSGVILSSFWGGYALLQVIGGKLADRVGGEKMLLLAILIWSAATFLTPSVAALGAVPMVGIRVLLGAGEGLAFPAIHSMVQTYVPAERRNSVVAFITAACYLGALIGNAFAPFLILTVGWENMFFLFAFVPLLLWMPLWLTFISVNSNNNNQQLLASPVRVEKDENIKTKGASLVEFIKSPPVLAICAAQYGQSFGMIGLLSWLPTYFSDRFQIPMDNLDRFTVLPYFLQLIVSVLAGVLADTLIGRKLPVLAVRKSLQTAGMLGPAVCLWLVATSNSLTPDNALLLMTCGSGAGALTSAGVSCNHFDIAPRNAGTVFAIGNTVSCLAGLVAVPLSGYLFQTTHSWNTIFMVFVAHYIGGAFLFNLMASDQRLACDR